LILRLKEQPRPPYAHRDFDQLWLDFPKLGGYFQVPGTLNYLVMTLVFIEIDRRKIFERYSFSLKIKRDYISA